MMRATFTLFASFLPLSLNGQYPRELPHVRLQLTNAHVCPLADSLIGRPWLTKGLLVEAGYDINTGGTVLSVPIRAAKPPVGSTHLAGFYTIVALPPGQPFRLPDADLWLPIVDSVYADSDTRAVTLTVDDTMSWDLGFPRIDEVPKVHAAGIMRNVMVHLDADRFRMLARAQRVRGAVGPFAFQLYDWEIHDVNTVYRASLCGTGLHRPH
jgi:hypothetical protein